MYKVHWTVEASVGLSAQLYTVFSSKQSSGTLAVTLMEVLPDIEILVGRTVVEYSYYLLT